MLAIKNICAKPKHCNFNPHRVTFYCMLFSLVELRPHLCASGYLFYITNTFWSTTKHFGFWNLSFKIILKIKVTFWQHKRKFTTQTIKGRYVENQKTSILFHQVEKCYEYVYPQVTLNYFCVVLAWILSKDVVLAVQY